MRQFPATIQQIIQQSGLNLNNISQASGISNAYLAKLLQGGINRPGKDKIASVLLALNYTISEINAVLADYDYLPLHQDDIPEILANNRARKITGGCLPQYDHIYFDLLLVALERIGGKKILVKNRPSGVFMPHELYLMKEYPFEENDEAALFRHSLTRAILEERSEIFLANCRAGIGSETYICITCLTEWLDRNIGLAAQKSSAQRVELVVRYFANALSLTLKEPESHRIFMMERCPYFHFLMQDADGETPKVSYPGRKLHWFDNEWDKRMLEGFTTDLSTLIAHFRHEIEMCRGAVLPELRAGDGEALKAYCLELFGRHGLERELEHELAGLMVDRQLRFY